MKADKILVPTDFSTLSDAAMPLAASLARDSGAKLLIVHVEETPLAYGGGEMYYGAPEPDNQELTRMLKEVKPADPQVEFEHHLIVGEPASGIVRFAEEQDVDMIVIGTHGRTGLNRIVMGSIAEAVVRRAECPVLVVKHPEHKLAEPNQSEPPPSEGSTP